MATCRAFDSHGCRTGDTTVTGGWQDRPITLGTAAHLYDGHAVCVDFLAHLVGVDAFTAYYGWTVGVKQRCVDVFVVQGEQTVITLAALKRASIGKKCMPS